MSESPRGIREGLQDNAIRKKGSLLLTQVRAPATSNAVVWGQRAPSPSYCTNLYGEHMPLVVGLSGLQSNFIGQNFPVGGTFQGISAPFLIGRQRSVLSWFRWPDNHPEVGRPTPNLSCLPWRCFCSPHNVNYSSENLTDPWSCSTHYSVSRLFE